MNKCIFCLKELSNNYMCNICDVTYMIIYFNKKTDKSIYYRIAFYFKDSQMIKYYPNYQELLLDDNLIHFFSFDNLTKKEIINKIQVLETFK